jgi:hypothetical protein
MQIVFIPYNGTLQVVILSCKKMLEILKGLAQGTFAVKRM